MKTLSQLANQDKVTVKILCEITYSNYHIREVQNIELTADSRGWTYIHADKFVPQQTSTARRK